MQRQLKRKNTVDPERQRLLGEAPGIYHRVYSHAGDTEQCMVCTAKDFSGYLTELWDGTPCIDTARMLMEAMGS